jgi:hypothetical protein
MEVGQKSNQKIEDYASDKYVIFSTELGYRMWERKDYEILAEIMGEDPNNVVEIHESTERSGNGLNAILLRKNGAEMLSLESKLDEGLIFIVPEYEVREVARYIAEKLKGKKAYVALHENSTGNGHLELLNFFGRSVMEKDGRTKRIGTTKRYSHETDLPVYGEFSTILKKLADNGNIETKDYQRLVESINGEEESSISEVTPREE